MTSTLKNGYCYLCTAGHIDVIPTMGTYASCQFQVPVRYSGGRVVASAPCGLPTVEVADPGGALEATFRVGGPRAVLEALSEMVAREGAASASADR